MLSHLLITDCLNLCPQRHLSGNIWNQKILFNSSQRRKSLLPKFKGNTYKIIILPVVFYGCETLSLTLREEHRLRVFENNVYRKIFGTKRDEITGEQRKLHIGVILVHSSFNIFFVFLRYSLFNYDPRIISSYRNVSLLVKWKRVLNAVNSVTFNIIIIIIIIGLPLWSRRQHARLSRSGPGFDPRSGQVSWVMFFSGFFLTCKTNVRKLQAHKFPEYHLTAIILISYSPCWNE